MQTLIIGHRGARGERPENTLQAFAHAKEVGAAAIETDIAVTADFVPVLHHDAHLPDGRLIREIDFADLPASVPSLEQALAAVPDIDWLLEVKTYPVTPEYSHPPEHMVAAVLAALQGFERSRLRLMAFEWEVLRVAARLAPNLRQVCLTAPGMAAARGLWWGQGFDALSVPRAVAAAGAPSWAPHHKNLGASEIEEAHRLGLEVLAWTVNEAAEFLRLRGKVAAIITDHPSQFIDQAK